MSKPRMNPRRFGQVVPPVYPFPCPTPPGEDYFYEPARMMAEAGFEAEILTTRTPEQSAEEQIGPVRVRRFDSKTALARHVRRSRYELIHAHSDFRPALLTGLLARGSKTIFTRHSYVLPRSAWKRRALAGLMNRFDRVVALTPYEREVYVVAGVRASRIVVLPNPINVTFFSQPGDANRFRRRWKIPARACVLLFVANLRPVKNIETALRALAFVRERMPETWLVAAGADLLPRHKSPSVTELARRGGVEGTTVFTDWLDAESLRDAFTAADVVINSSFNEGLPLSLCEAAAVGKPLCLSAIGSLKSTFGDAALYHDPTDADGLARNILRYLGDAEVRKAHVQRCRQIVSSFDLPLVRKQMRGLYFSLLAQ